MITVMLVVMTLCQGPTTTLAGTVVDQDGKPVVGAELVLTNPTPGEAPVVARGKSGAGVDSTRIVRPGWQRRTAILSPRCGQSPRGVVSV